MKEIQMYVSFFIVVSIDDWTENKNKNFKLNIQLTTQTNHGRIYSIRFL